MVLTSIPEADVPAFINSFFNRGFLIGDIIEALHRRSYARYTVSFTDIHILVHNSAKKLIWKTVSSPEFDPAEV